MTEEVRPFAKSDAPAVAELFLTTFRSNLTALDETTAYFQKLFLEDNYDEGSPSLVYVAAGDEVRGFIGSLPLTFESPSGPFKAAHACCHMVRDPRRDTLGGARLLRSFLSGAQELSYSETASQLSSTLWQRLGARVLPQYSLNWIRLLSPCTGALSMAGASQSWIRPFQIMAPAADLVLRKSGLFSALFQAADSPRKVHAQSCSVAEFATTAAELLRQYSVYPRWSTDVILARLQETEQALASHRFEFKIVLDAGGRPVGGFILVCRDRTARVLQILTSQANADDVVATLIETARALGIAAIFGRTDPNTMNALADHQCIFVRRGSAVAVSRNPEILRDISSQPAMLTGLAGETWSKLIHGLGPQPHGN